MKLVVVGDANPNGKRGVVLRERNAVLLWPHVEAEHGAAPSGCFYVLDEPGALRGAAERPHYTLPAHASVDREICFRFQLTDYEVALERRVVVVSRPGRVLAIVALSLAVILLCLAGWMLQQGLGAFMPELGPFRTWIAAGVTAIVSGAGIELARGWSVVWHWKRCLVLLLASAVLALLPLGLVVRVENGTKSEIELSREHDIRIAAGSTALVPRHLGSRTWREPEWLDGAFHCVGSDAGCERGKVEVPWWLSIWPREVTIGCNARKIAKEYHAAWQEQPLCKPAATFSVNVSIPSGDKAWAHTRASLAPLESSRLEASLTEAHMDFSEYYQLQVRGTASDLVLQIEGEHRFEAAIIPLREQAQGAARPVPLLLPRHAGHPGDGTLLGRVQLGPIEVGRLTCVLDGSSPIDLRTLTGSRHLSQVMLYRGEVLFSAFEASRPELGHELVLCWPHAANESDRLEVVIGTNWVPAGFQMAVPGRTLPPQTQFFGPEGRLWGTVLCDAATASSLQALSVPAHDSVVSVRPPASQRPMWSARQEESVFVSWFVRCNPSKGDYSVRLLRAGDRTLVHPGTNQVQLKSLEARACKIDFFHGDELTAVQARSRRCELPAGPQLKEHPIPGCSALTSVLCR